MTTKEKMSNDLFSTIYKDNYRPIYIFINRTIKDKMLVEDLLQETFAKVFLNYDNLYIPEKSSLSSWIHNIAKNTVIDYVRQCYDEKYVLVSQFATEDNESGDKIFNFARTSVNDNQLENDELRAEIKKSISSLAPKYRMIAKLYFKNECTYNEIGTLLELPEGSVKGMIFRVREMLQASLKQYVNA
jgi:RNA polymerase sigma-70 factor (ECF subfamily)